MNNIYKVIWSKAKNCYVVASEIARSHTKSASGSEKIGGGTRRKLLASLMALSLLCGGLGVASAADGTVHVDESTPGAAEVYTTAKVDTLLKDKADKTALENKANAAEVAVNAEKIATNKANITALQSELGNKADATALAGKANTNLDNLSDTGKLVIKATMSEDMDSKANKAEVYSRTEANTTFATKTELDAKADATALDDKANTDLSNLTADGKTKIKETMSEDMEKKADKTYVDTALAGKANKADLDTATGRIGTNETDIAKLKEQTAEISHAVGAGTSISGVTIKDGNIIGNNSAITGLTNVETGSIKTDSINGKSLATTAVATEKEVNDEKTEREKKDNELEGKITQNTQDIATLDKSSVKYDTDVKDTITLKGADSTKITNLKDADLSDSSTDAVTGKQLNKTNEDLKKEAQTRQDMDTLLSNRADALEKNTGGITRNDAKYETYIEKNVTVDNQGSITAQGKVTANGGVDAGAGAITTTGAVNAGSLTVENASTLKGNVTMDKKLSVTGDTSLGKTDVGGALNVTGESNLQGNVILGKNTANTVTVNGKSDFKAAVEMDDGLTVKNGDTNLKNTTVEGNLKVTGTITTDKMVFGDKATNNYTEIDKGHITSKNAALAGDATQNSSSMELDRSKLEVAVADKNSNGHLTMTADKTTIKNSDLVEKNYSEIVADKDSVTTTVKDEENNTTSTKSTATEIRNYAKDAAGNKTINLQTATQNKSWAKDKDGNESSIVQTGKDITNTAQNGTITNDAKDIVNKATTMKTTVTGKATESYGELETTVNGKETHNVTGTKTENVTGKVTENYNGGQETNVTGNQDIHVTKNQTNRIDGDQVNIIGGSQTTTATDINRNASSGMIDTIDNDYGTNKETKVAGETKTEVSIKGTDEKGEYIRGATQSRDYLIKGTLKNSETKTAEATTSEVTDGTNKASTRQDAKNLAGSVTNGNETGVSGIHANKDGSVSIDSTVVGGGMSSVINQKKDSITSAVGNADGSISTVIRQDKDNVVIASSKGMVGIVGKDIVNNAQETITNTAGTSITNQVKDSKVTTDASGTTFENKTAAVSDGGTITTKINGNRINTGRVDANELGVSDVDGDNTANLTVQAGEDGGVKASASKGTTKGSLDVTAKEIGSSVTDASGKGSTFKQRIDAIMMESKDVSITAEGTLTNNAKDIVTNASNSITEKVGETNVTTKTTTSSKSEIQNADTITSVQQTENMVQSFVGKKDFSVTNVTTNFANASANQVTENGQTSTVLNNKDGLLIQNTANGNSFTTADGTNTGPALEWTNIKGNEISTGKVEANYAKMNYADVMKDLGVHGNAKVGQNLEVGGTSTLKGDVTMGSNATVEKDLNVKGTTTTKTLKVTENAEVGGTLKVAKKATFEDSVSIAKDLSVTGDVTANSYKVGDKTYISADGINANNQKITNVADGSISEGSKDAVNGGQLYGMKTDLEHKVDKVGANAAAMANLHPMEFDPDSKWNIAAAMGNYGSETATAIGAFYRPNEDVMVNFSTAFGTGENMVGGGVSVRLGKGSNKLSREESNALKDQVNDLTARMDALLSVLNPNMSKDFPDVPENHWAYEAVSRLAGNDIVQGYPDGEFHGDRTMTRYEMAEIIYNALSRGAEAERELVEEFKPELQAMAASEKATAERAEG